MSGVLHGVLASLKAAAAAVTDAYFKYVSLLLNTTSTNGAQNNTFLDSSTNAFSITRNGNATQGNFSPFSQTGWSNFFDGTGDWLNTTVSPATLSGDFTLEGWVYITSLAANRPIACIGDDFQSTGLAFFVNTSNRLGLFGNNASILTGTTETVALNAWNHVACVRSSGTIRVYLNGNADSTTASNATSFSGAIQIGRELYNAATGILMLGYISNFRLVTSAVYTANFTPPTSPLTNITNTSLLTCQSNRFIDNSSNAFAITRNGDVSVQAFSPFAPAAAWSAATYGGSGYFDGTGDSLTTPYSTTAFDWFTSGTDYTIEALVYPNSLTTWSAPDAIPTLVGNMETAGFSTYWAFGPASNGTIKFYYYTGASVTVTSTATITAGQWSHIAMTKTSSGITLFVNGKKETTVAISGTPQSSTSLSLCIGQRYNTSINGYVNGLRIVKGTAVYTADFTPPTAPFTAITNTSLLLNFTNAGIYDSASGNDLETVGNAQVSTVQAKWGTTSMAFDGTGDWLFQIDRPTLRLGSGDFTIEGWVYLNAAGVAYGLISKGTAITGWSVNVTAGNKLQFSYTATQLTGATSLAATTWYYFAVVRSGSASGNLKIYLDGVADATSAGAVTDNFSGTDVMYIGADRVAGSNFNGYLDDVRITNGYARTISTPTAAFPVQ